MKHNQKIIFIFISLILVFTLSFSAIASARDVLTAAAGTPDDEIERGIAWEMLNSLVPQAENLLVPGSDFSHDYNTALRNHIDYAKHLLDSTTSATAQLKDMYDDLDYLIAERNNPANHERFGYYTVAFTNDGSWSEPIYLYNWSDDGGELQPFPGEAMKGGYTNEYGQKQYYAFVPMDVPNIVISTNQAAATDPDHVVLCVRLQTVDIFVCGNTGYYLTGAREGAKYKVAEWQLKAPAYKSFVFSDPEPPEPITEAPTAEPTEPPTAAPTEKPSDAPVSELTEAPTEPQPHWNYVIGDADGDGTVTVLDATRIQRVLADFDKENRATAERCGCMTSSSLSILDATAIQRYLAGFPDPYGIGATVIPTGLKRS